MAGPLHTTLIVLVTSKLLFSLPFFIALCSAGQRPTRSIPAVYGQALWDFKISAQLHTAPTATLLFVLAVGDVILAIFVPGEVRVACIVTVVCSGIILLACANIFRLSLGARAAFQDAVRDLPHQKSQAKSVVDRDGEALLALPMPLGHMTVKRRLECFLPIGCNQRKVDILKDLAYTSTDCKSHRLDWIRRRDVCAGAPTLLYIHGGGWTSGDKSAASLPTLYEFAAETAWNVLTINYTMQNHDRSTPLWPTNLHDCFRAVAWARENVATGGVPLVVMGDSAGGHLASLAGLTHTVSHMLPADVQGKDVTINAVIDLYGFCHDITDVNGHYESFGVDIEKVVDSILMESSSAARSHELDDLNPLWWLQKVQTGSIPEPPPFFVAHGNNDDCVPAADVVSFVEALADMRTACGSRHKVPDIHVQAPGIGHAFNYMYSPSSFALSDSLGLFCRAIAASRTL